jgi:rare lipoprotein A
VQRQNVCRPLSCFLLALFLIVPLTPSRAEPQDLRLASLDVQMTETGIFGTASTYDPLTAKEPEGMETASGETYDPETWTAAIQIALRGEFGGVHYGHNYRPAFALVECGAKRVIVRINDVGPLMPGRIIDLNTRTMRYFDPGFELGLVHYVTVTPLPGENWIAGPLDGEENETIVLSARQR